MRLSRLLMFHARRTGPLQTFIRAGKLIPRTIDPWLSIQQIFTTSLAAEGLLQAEDDDLENDAEDQDRYFYYVLLSICA